MGDMFPALVKRKNIISSMAWWKRK